MSDPVTLLLPPNRHLISVLMREMSGAASLYSENKRKVLQRIALCQPPVDIHS